MRSWTFLAAAFVVGIIVFGISLLIKNDYVFFAGYVVLNYIVLATAWNILGGYCGYVNFGSAAFFAVGAYTAVALHKFEPARAELSLFGWDLPLGFLAPLFPMSIPVLIIIGGIISGIVGLGTGYLTLRLRGAFFAIATLALAVVLQTLIVNWDYVGGSRGAYILRPQTIDIGDFHLSYIQYLYLVMLALAIFAVVVARLIERSRLGYGFATIRDDELAAEASGVPTLRLKLIATTISGALMGMSGAPLPYYIGYLEPSSAFGLGYAVNSIAMPMIGGTGSWLGPVIGAILLGSLQQLATVTISSAVNLLFVGVLLVAFVIIAPNGIIGLVHDFIRTAAPARTDARAIVLVVIAICTFLIGILGVVYSLSVIASATTTGQNLFGSVALVFAILFTVAAYGLLTLHRWAPRLAVGLFAVSIALAVTHSMMVGQNLERPIVAAVVAAIAGWYLLQANVRTLYRPVARMA